MILDSSVERARVCGWRVGWLRRAEREAVPPIDAADRPSSIRPTQEMRRAERHEARFHEAFRGLMSD